MLLEDQISHIRGREWLARCDEEGCCCPVLEAAVMSPVLTIVFGFDLSEELRTEGLGIECVTGISCLGCLMANSSSRCVLTGSCGVMQAREGACANASAILRPAVVFESPDVRA